jgi:hypothetical protein
MCNVNCCYIILVHPCHSFNNTSVLGVLQIFSPPAWTCILSMLSKDSLPKSHYYESSYKGRTIRNPGRGYKIFAPRFFFSLMSLQDFFYAFNLCKNFFQDYLHFAVCLHDFFFSDVMAARIFFQAFFFARIFWGGIFTPPPPPPGISNGPPLNSTFQASVIKFQTHVAYNEPGSVSEFLNSVLYVQYIYFSVLERHYQ